MHKEIIICIIVIILVIGLDILTRNYTKNTVEIINRKLSDFKELLIEEAEQEKVKEINDDIMNEWQEKYEVLAYYIEHDELEKVETELTALTSSIDVVQYNDGVENLDRCIFILNHIKDKYIVEIKNIF